MKRDSKSGASAEVRNIRGLELADRGWLEEALREFDLAIETDPRSAYPRVNRAGVLLECGHYLEAMEDLLEAARLEPENGAVHYHLGLCLSRFGSDVAVAELQKAIELEPGNLDAHIQLAAAYSAQGLFGRAEQQLRHVLALEPADPCAHRELGALLLDTEKAHQAIDHLRLAADCWPEEIDILLDLSTAYIQAGFFQQAELYLRKVLSLDSSNLHGHYNLAALYAEWGRRTQALEHMGQALQIYSGSVKEWFETDPMFDCLRNDEDVRKLMASPLS